MVREDDYDNGHANVQQIERCQNTKRIVINDNNKVIRFEIYIILINCILIFNK